MPFTGHLLGQASAWEEQGEKGRGYLVNFSSPQCQTGVHEHTEEEGAWLTHSTAPGAQSHRQPVTSQCWLPFS